MSTRSDAPSLTFVEVFPVPAKPAVTTSEDYFRARGMSQLSLEFQKHFLGLKVSATPAGDLLVCRLNPFSGPDIVILLGGGDDVLISVPQLGYFLSYHRASPERFGCFLRGKDCRIYAIRPYWNRRDECWYLPAVPASTSSVRNMHNEAILSKEIG